MERIVDSLVESNDSVARNSFWEFKGQEDFIDNWFMMSTPAPISLIAVAYLLFVLKIGPNSMKNRQPFKLNNLLVLYNFVQVLASVYLFNFGLKLILAKGLLMQNNCALNKDDVFQIATGMYLYFAAKASELLDTIFFVLRKKNNQVTFLHVYHHSLMLIMSWYTLKYEPTHATVFIGTVNCLVHVVMYAYYGLSAFPNLTKYLWWKKYITSMQLIQFLMILIQNIINYAWAGCKPSFFMMNMIIVNGLLFIYLFGDFYVKSYIKKQSKAKLAAENREAKAKKTKFINGTGKEKEDLARKCL